MAGGKLISTGVEFPDATTQTTSGLPLTGGALTGAVTTTSTFDGRDVAADGVTADAALPKAGGTMTGTIAGFTSTGIDDNATSTAITIDASENVTFTGTLNGISTTKSASGNRWGVLPAVESNGVMEVGRYIDFHETDADTSDYGARLELSGTQLISTHGIYAAAGVYLGGTAAANKLDDYETGTWTPVPAFAVPGTSSYVAVGGTYRKIGSSVSITCHMNINKGTATGAFGISGLPFTVGNGSAYSNSFAVAADRIGAGTENLFGLCTQNSATATIRRKATGIAGRWGSISNSDVDTNTATLYFEATYHV